MKANKLWILFWASFSPFILLAQTTYKEGVCGTDSPSDSVMQSMEWYNNNGYLDNKLDTMGYFEKSIFPTQYRIPIKLWLHRDNNGIYPIDPFTATRTRFNLVEVKNLIRDINELQKANNTGILYYIRDFEFIDRTALLTADKLSLRTHWNGQQRYEANAVNIHLVETATSGATVLNGFVFEWDHLGLEKFVVLDYDVLNSRMRSTAAHELGHYFGLVHTFENSENDCSFFNRKPEIVNHGIAYNCRLNGDIDTRLFENAGLDWKTCENTGDNLCDTEAAYDFNAVGRTANVNSKTCLYNGLENDLLGIPYSSVASFTKNMMSSNSAPGGVSCRTRFSPSQVAIMWDALDDSKYWLWDYNYGWFPNERTLFDSYEPDNIPEWAERIGIAYPQHRSFHSTLEADGTYSDNDVDWVRLEIPANAPAELVIETMPASFLHPDTYLELYDASLTLLAFDDDGNGDGFSRLLVKNPVPSALYYIRITKKNSFCCSQIGDYKLLVSESIPYLERTCTSIDTGQTSSLKGIYIKVEPCRSTIVVRNGGTLHLQAQEEIVFLPNTRDIIVEQGADLVAEIVNFSSKDMNSFATISTLDSLEIYYFGIPENHTLAQKSMPSTAQMVQTTSQAIETGLPSTFSVYPNPTQGIFSVSYPSDEQVHTVQIFDAQGKNVYQYIGSAPPTELDLSASPAGIYLVCIQTNSQIHTTRLFKN